MALENSWYISYDGCKHFFINTKLYKEMFLQPDGTFAEQEFKQKQGENMKHKYAEILIAIANREQLQELKQETWCDITHELALYLIRHAETSHGKLTIKPEDFRVKPKTIMIGKHEVEAPISVAPAEKSLCFAVSTDNINYHYTVVWLNEEIDFRYLHRGILHTTKEAAIAHAKALLSFTQTGE